MSGFVLPVTRLDMRTNFHSVRTTGMELATLGRIGRGRDIPFQNRTVHLLARIGIGYRRKQCARVGVQGIIEDFVLRPELHHATEIHNADLIGNIFYDRQIVRNEQISESPFLLQFFKQVDNLRLNGNVERRNGFVANNEFGVYRKGARNADTLALAAREFVRIALVIIVSESATFHEL